MKSFFLLLIPFILFSLSGCAPKYDYTIHKPKVKYKKPSKDALARTLKEKLGTKYVWAEEGPSAFDCSGLTYYSYGRMNMAIPRVAREQAKVGRTVSLNALSYGDLIFFDTSKHFTGKVTHVGVYIGNGKFQHASSSKEGVIISDVNSSYYQSRVIVCKRYLPDDSQTTSALQPFPVSAPLQAPKPTITEPIGVVAPMDIQEQTIQSPTGATIPATPISGQYYIQVGTFSNTPNQALFQQITSSGYHYQVTQASGLNKVLIGPYASQEEAQHNLEGIRETILPDAFIVMP